jgi:hypothetical protein
VVWCQHANIGAALLRLCVLLPQMENLALKHCALLHDEFI